MLAEIRAKKPFNGQRARLTVDGARPISITWDTYMVKLKIYLVSLAPRDNNYLIQNISQNNSAQASKERGLHI